MHGEDAVAVHLQADGLLIVEPWKTGRRLSWACTGRPEGNRSPPGKSKTVVEIPAGLPT